MRSTSNNIATESLTDKLKKTTAIIYYVEEFLSSGIIFNLDDSFYIITAGHSVFGNDFSETKDLKKIKANVNELELKIDSAITDSAFAKKHDLVLLKVLKNDQLKGSININFYSEPKNPLHNLIFRGSYNPEKDINNFWDNLPDETISDSSQFKIRCNKAFLSNSSYDHGSDWLDGISGSGLFYQDKKEVCCCGIIIEIPNKGDDGKIICASFKPLLTFLPSFILNQSETFDTDTDLNRISLSTIIDKYDSQAIFEWEHNSENDPRIEFINDKLPLIYSEAQLIKQKSNLIRNFRIGLDLIELNLIENERLHSKYQDAYKAYSIQDNEIYADTRKEARGELKKIKDEYELYLQNILTENGFNLPMIKILKEYAISEWISNCSISILKDE